MRGGSAQVKRRSKLPHFHLAAVTGKDLQHTCQPVNDLNRGAAPDHSLLGALAGWLPPGEHDLFAGRCPHCGTPDVIHSFSSVSRPDGLIARPVWLGRSIEVLSTRRATLSCVLV